MSKYLCAVVNTLLELCWDFGYRVTPLYLQKLLYFYYVEYLNEKIREMPERPIKFEAWKYGPVNKELYYSLRKYRSREEITEPITYDNDIYTLGYKEIAQRTVETYGKYTTKSLVNMSHEPGGAWDRAVSEGHPEYINSGDIERDIEVIWQTVK